tara:strand:- start:12850 stop:13104 length:255 start_codon:yes stop_codon:yes gene_type:complete
LICGQQSLKSIETSRDPGRILTIDCIIAGTELIAQRFQYAPIVDRMDVAADDSRQCPHMRSIIDMGRQQSGRWIAFFQPLDDGW